MKNKIPQEILDRFVNYVWFNPDRVKYNKTSKSFEYNGFIGFGSESFTEIPTAMLYFSKIKYNLVLRNCQKLTSLENLENLKYIGGYLDLYNTAIENLKGLENLERVGKSISIEKCKLLKTFDGLNPFVEVYGHDSVPYSYRYGNGTKIYPKSKEQEFLHWQKTKQIKEISKFLECV